MELSSSERQYIIRTNKRLNIESLKRKVFCVGLHKQGTCSLDMLARLYGYTSIHSQDWCLNHDQLSYFNFFSDGGSHYDGINEFDYPRLARQFPDSLFILQSRDPLPWIISKLKHAGWDQSTEAVKQVKGTSKNEEFQACSHLQKNALRRQGVN
jgi:hypothetical protein